jgi:hypothetical protein
MENLSPESKEKVLKAVKKQVEEKEPEVTSMTFEKLVKNGIPKEDAYEILGRELVGEMSDMMGEEREFDLKKWSTRLNDL